MNLEDFKSFRRVLKPLEVGSIPTHSRHALPAAARAALVACCALAASACAGSRPVGSAADLEAPSPANRAARSAVFPAWGQLTNGKSAKAAGLFALETYLITGIVVESRRGQADRRIAETATDEATREVYDGIADGHYDRRRNLLFWTLLTVVYGVIDAYVDGYLGRFDEEIEDRRERSMKGKRLRCDAHLVEGSRCRLAEVALLGRDPGPGHEQDRLVGVKQLHRVVSAGRAGMGALRLRSNSRSASTRLRMSRRVFLKSS